MNMNMNTLILINHRWIWIWISTKLFIFIFITGPYEGSCWNGWSSFCLLADLFEGDHFHVEVVESHSGSSECLKCLTKLTMRDEIWFGRPLPSYYLSPRRDTHVPRCTNLGSALETTYNATWSEMNQWFGSDGVGLIVGLWMCHEFRRYLSLLTGYSYETSSWLATFTSSPINTS